ncbi:MAG: ATP-binding cassette domain-containing protein [Gammaproteobacteria bacterium]|nr:ATP-binding cassette domain-containing protein [Gammaproteobacteria bacterium]
MSAISAAMAPMIEVSDLRYDSAGRRIFAGLNLAIRRGSITAIMGPSGTGKTTLLRLITGQIRPKSGQLKVDGAEVASLDRRELFRLRRRMGMLFQNSALLTDYSVFDNVAFPVREHTALDERLIRTLVLMKLQAVGLRGAADLMPAQLSGGMSRRVALARAMVLDPDLLLYDEPFSGLDPISMGMVLRLIKVNNDVLGVTSVVVTHDVEEISRIADYCYVVSGGQVIGAGTPAELGQSDSAMVRQFMSGAPDGPVPFHYPAAAYETQLLGGQRS